MYGYRSSPSPLISIVWYAEVDSDGEYVDAANEFWGLGFGIEPDGQPTTALIGPSLTPRTVPVRTGGRYWGVEFRAHVFLLRVPKLGVLGEIRPLPTDGKFFELAGVRYPVPGYGSMEALVDTLVGQGVLTARPEIAEALGGGDPGYSERNLRRRCTIAVGFGPHKVEQLRPGLRRPGAHDPGVPGDRGPHAGEHPRR